MFFALTCAIAERRAIISRAALLVNVTAMTPAAETCPVFSNQAILVVNTRVLPDPAPASINADWGGNVTAESCSGLRFSNSLSISTLSSK